MKLIFSPPSSSEPGFLRRQKSALEMYSEFQSNPSVEAVDKLVEFLLPYVEEPEDRNVAREALWDASENEINTLIKAIVGGEENPTST